MAAKFAARRVASECNEEIGQTVGYQFRFEKVAGPRTSLLFLTEGIFLRRLLDDPTLRDVGIVILDEFHERHLQTDLALGYLRHLQTTSRPDLKILVMSATLDTQALEAFLPGTPLLNLEIPVHPLEIKYLEKPSTEYLDSQVKNAVEGILRKPAIRGDVLVFLPGMAEIRRSEEKLLGARLSVDIFALHGDLSREEQDRALLPGPRRKVILSTNLAESSVTIEGLGVVIDAGLHRQASFSPWNGLPLLKTTKISKASAVQRAGRSAREGPGLCLRLYTKLDFDGRQAFDQAEVHRVDLCQSVLELKRLGIKALRKFQWFESPSEKMISAAETLLFQLEALSDLSAESDLTEIGSALARLPLHPRLGRFLLAAQKEGLSFEATHLAALMNEGGMESIDLLKGLDAPLNRTQKRVQEQLLEQLPSSAAKSTLKEASLAKALLRAFPDRVAKKRRDSSGQNPQVEVIFSGGASVALKAHELLSTSDYFVVTEIQEVQQLGKKALPVVRSLCAIQEEWLFDIHAPGVHEEDVLRWDSKRNKVVKESRLKYAELVLTESIQDAEAGPEAAKILFQELFKNLSSESSAEDWIQALPRLGLEAAQVDGIFAKRKLLAEFFDKLSIETPSGLWFERIIGDNLQGITQLEMVKSLDWENLFFSDFPAEALRHLESLLPRSLALPNGKKVPIHYELGQPPWVESRLQDFFGMRESPKILKGRLSLTVRLLAPNYRPIQITSDLAGFWTRVYLEIRPQLSRRYPRHSWPEKP